MTLTGEALLQHARERAVLVRLQIGGMFDELHAVASPDVVHGDPLHGMSWHEEGEMRKVKLVKSEK